jgi:hypothetical protein
MMVSISINPQTFQNYGNLCQKKRRKPKALQANIKDEDLAVG